MDRIELFQIDAFTDKLFHGNPAMICLLSEWLNDELLQAIAQENHLSETAFVIPQEEGHHIRWFTPKVELNLSGHSTLAAAFLLFELGRPQTDTIRFSSLGGTFTVKRHDNKLVMDFPQHGLSVLEDSKPITALLDKAPIECYDSELDYVVLLEKEADVATAQVNYHALAALPKRGLILTAPSEDADFYSRCFYPKYDIFEDHVTGSAYCMLAPFWADRLQKKTLFASQGSSRRGQVTTQVTENSVYISGACKWYSRGQLML